jgi:D-alanine-D-alanine ligase
MEQGKLKVALVFGGQSAEHEVSLRSAASVFEAVDADRYSVLPIIITRDGAWYRLPASVHSFTGDKEPVESHRVILSPDPSHGGFLATGTSSEIGPIKVDVVFPILHGTYGEDGALQGLLELARIPYVGCGVLASSVGMDKVVMKSAFRDSGLRIGPFKWFLRSAWKRDPGAIIEIIGGLQFPLFVKPANLGSSVGISRVATESEFVHAVDLACEYDRKILVEQGIPGREIEVSVLGNDDPRASVAGEIIPGSEYYDYEEKYLKDSTKLIIPAELTQDIQIEAGKTALTAFKAVDGSGLSRVDMFLTPNGEVIVNEINTIPGFTSASMYPKLWEASGVPYGSLIDRLIELALERHRDKQLNKIHRS